MPCRSFTSFYTSYIYRWTFFWLLTSYCRCSFNCTFWQTVSRLNNSNTLGISNSFTNYNIIAIIKFYSWTCWCIYRYIRNTTSLAAKIILNTWGWCCWTSIRTCYSKPTLSIFINNFSISWITSTGMSTCHAISYFIS